MRVCRGWRHFPESLKGGVVAIGNFDGVHRGHQALIERAIQRAQDLGAPSGAMVFEPHPRAYFHPGEPHFELTPIDQKLEVLATLGLDFAVVAAFDSEFAALDNEAFAATVLTGALAVRHVVIGYDFFYGKGRGGSPDTMRSAGRELGFEVTVVEPVADDGEVFSSTGIRLKLAQGDVEGAARDLGRRWRVRGPVVGGAKRGTGLGYPTANLPMPKGTALGHGIYAVLAHLDGRTHKAAAYLGTRPTFDDGHPVLEVFLLDFEGDLYGREMDVEFVAFLRADRKFDNPTALIAQMDADVAAARAALASF